MKILSILFCFIFIIFTTEIGFSQEKKLEKKDSDSPEFSVVPYINYNTNLQFMIGAIPMVMYKANKKDTISPKSLSGVSGVYTTNESYFLVGFTRIYLAEDAWRLTGYGFYGNLNSQLFIDEFEVEGFVDYTSKTTAGGIGFDRKIIPHLYAGITYTIAHSESEAVQGLLSTDNTTHGLQFKVTSDTRNNVYYPTSGRKANLKYKAFPEWIGNDDSANKINLAYNQYFAVGKKNDVVAARIFGVVGLGEINFEQQVVIGRKDIRGYSSSKYRGDSKLSAQGEYRWNFGERSGAVGFAGLATIYGSSNSNFNGELYPGVGVGYRYKAFEKSNFNVGLDGAVGKDDWGVYFRIGEAF